MLVYGYNFSQFKTNKLENTKRLQLKRKSGEGFTPAVGWCDTIKMCANTEKKRITGVYNKHKRFLKIYVHVMSGDMYTKNCGSFTLAMWKHGRRLWVAGICLFHFMMNYLMSRAC